MTSFSFPPSFIKDLSKPTPFLGGIPLWIFILLCAAIILILLSLLCFCLLCLTRKRKPVTISHTTTAADYHRENHFLDRHFNVTPSNNNLPRNQSTAMNRRLLSLNADVESGNNFIGYCDSVIPSDGNVHFRSGSGVALLKRIGSVSCGCEEYSLTEIEEATNRFDEKNLIGVGPHGIVYRGVLLDGRRVAVKKLLNNRIQSEVFKMQVQTMQNLTHKNLVKIIGFCVEGDNRMLVNEYVDNGNLHHWLHAYGAVLTWENRMEIILGIAKVLAYFHEDVEPNLIHQGIKSTNILLNRQWIPKISDYGLGSLSTSTYASSPVSSSEVVSSTTVSDKADDVYSFGVLLMEIISGRKPVVEYSNREDMYLPRWLKSMVSEHKHEQVLDYKIQDSPPEMKELKRIILIALRCADPSEDKRPRMTQVIHMLEPRDLLLCDESETGMEVYRRTGSQASKGSPQDVLPRKIVMEFDCEPVDRSKNNCVIDQ